METTTIQIGRHRQIVLPVEVCREVGVAEGDFLEVQAKKDGKIVLAPQTMSDKKAKMLLFQMITELREKFKDIPDDQIEKILSNAVESAKREELQRNA